MPRVNKIKVKIVRGLKAIRFWSYFTVLLIFMLVGAWCIPPKWFERVLEEIKAKYTVEKILEDES